MNWVLITITLIILAVFLLELWTVLRRVPHEAAAPPFSPSSMLPTNTTITTPATPATTITIPTRIDQQETTTTTTTTNLTLDREERIKQNLRNIVHRFQKSNVNLNDMLVFGRETAAQFEEYELHIYEPFITELMKKKCEPWPLLTKLALYRHGKKAKEMLIQEKRQGLIH